MRVVIAALLAAAIAGCSSTQTLQCGDASASRPPRNFGAVIEQRLYRGGQPASCGELEYLKSIGVRSILKLNDRGSPIDAEEKARAAAIGMTVRSFAFDAATIGETSTCSDVGEALRFLADERNWPLYVHCTAGKDRTGYMVGLYERLILKKSTEEILAELHRFGHRGARSLAMPQIDRELTRSDPDCRN